MNIHTSKAFFTLPKSNEIAKIKIKNSRICPNLISINQSSQKENTSSGIPSQGFHC